MCAAAGCGACALVFACKRLPVTAPCCCRQLVHTRCRNLALRLQLTKWKPTEAAPAEAQQAQRAKRADRYSSKELSSKQRLSELVEQHKAGRAASSKQQQQQGSFRR